MAEQVGIDVVIKVSGDPLSLTDEATSTSDNKSYQITDAAKQILDYNGSFTVKDNGVTTSEEYAINKLNGTVTFKTVDALRGPITISGTYLPMSTAAYAHAYTRRKECQLHDVTKFQDTHRKRLSGLKGATGSINQWDITDTYFSDTLTNGNPVVMEIKSYSGDVPERMWILIESKEMSAAIESAQDENVSYQSTDELLGRE